MKFKVDENLPIEVVELLEDNGHDALTVLGQNLGGEPDSRIAQVCKNEKRTLITLDTDFSDIRTYPPEDFFGLIVLRLKTQDKPHVLSVVSRGRKRFRIYPSGESRFKRCGLIDERNRSQIRLYRTSTHWARSVSRRIMKKNDLFEKISPNEALEILRQITKKDNSLKKKVVELAEDLFRDVDVDDICEAVFGALDGIDVHELWDRAGLKTDGYTSPEDMSVEMFEEALEPFVQEMQRLLNLKMLQEAKLYCMGILKGIYQYEEDSESEFKDWASDVPGESFGFILREWRKNRNKKDKQEMKDFIKNEFPAWSKWAIKQI